LAPLLTTLPTKTFFHSFLHNHRIYSLLARTIAISTLIPACFTGCTVRDAHASPAGVPTSDVASSSPSVTYSPVIITSGGTYEVNVVNDNPKVPAVSVETDQPVVITNSTVVSRGPLISIIGSGSGANVIITNTTGIGLDPQVAGQIRGVFVNAYNVASLFVQNTSMAGVSFGIKVLASTATKLRIYNNFAENLEDRESNGRGGLLTARPDLGHFIILNGVSAPNGADISWNKLVNTIGNGSTEDAINIYKSYGTEAHAIVAHDNYLEGFSSTTTPSYSGSGLVSDGDGNSPMTAYVYFSDNEIVHTAGSGVDIASGHNIVAEGNRVVSCGRNANGTWYAMPFANAVNIWNYRNSAQFYDNRIETTAGGLVRPNTNNSPMVADSWTYAPDMTDNNVLEKQAFTDPCIVNGQINLQAETNERTFWSNKIATARMLIGDQHDITAVSALLSSTNTDN
jgi:hypothetical protein